MAAGTGIACTAQGTRVLSGGSWLLMSRSRIRQTAAYRLTASVSAGPLPGVDLRCEGQEFIGA